MKTNRASIHARSGGRTTDKKEIARRLRALDMGFHSNRLEGVTMSDAKLAKARDMVRQGMDLEEVRTAMTGEFRAETQGR